MSCAGVESVVQIRFIGTTEVKKTLAKTELGQ